MARRSLFLLAALPLIAAPAPRATAADVPTCLGQPATIVGTAGDDDLYGTEGPDVIYGGVGVDQVWARGGDDVVCLSGPTDRVVFADVPDGTEGRVDERVEGGSGNDRIVGSRGPGLIYAGYGADEVWAITDAAAMDRLGFIDGSPGGSIIRGGPGPDRLHGNESGEWMAGGLGDDVLDSTGAYDRFVHDVLIGGPGDDRLSAGASSDILYGGRGNDMLSGGAGGDELRADNRWHGTEPGMFGDDVLLGGPGDDGLYGGGGTNDSDGGAGRDACMLPGPDEGATGCEVLGSYPGQVP